MNEILHANIFFVIASLATVVFSILVSVALYYVIKILIAIRAIVERIEAGSDMIAEDMVTFRRFVLGGGIVSHLVRFMTPKRKARRRSTTAHDVTSDSE